MTTTAQSELEALRAAEREAAAAHEQADAALTVARRRFAELEPAIRSGAQRGEVAEVDQLVHEQAELAAQLKGLEATAEASYHALRLARAHRADVERVELAERSVQLAAGVEGAVRDALAVMDGYLASRERYVQTLRDSNTHVGSVVNAPGFARPSGFAAQVLRLITSERGIS